MDIVKTPREMIRILPEEMKAEALKFILLGENLNCKSETRYAKANKYWRCVFKNKSPARVLFVIECTDKWWRIKTVFGEMNNYIKLLESCSEKLIEKIINAYDCHNCNTHCKGANPYIYKNNEYRKCIGCSYYFQDLKIDEWDYLRELIKADFLAMQSK